ncbi:MAG: hypothetical protein EBU12_02645 [Microbacteriaceae bacterium]|nr:hypothetical protein [Microbacteriaceae bacterium]
MATLGTQNISTSYVQLIKTSGLTGIDPTIQTITDGNNVSSALQLSTTGVNSTGTLNAVGATTLASTLGVTAACTLSSTLGVTGAVTLSSSLAVTGAATFSSSISATTGTATIGTESVNTSTIGTLAVTNTATIGTLKVGASGPRLTAASYGTAAFTLSTVQPHNLADTTTGTFALTGAALGDIVIGSIDSLGSTTGTTQIITSFFPIASNVVRYVVNSKGSTAGTVPAGTIYATAMRFVT